MPNPQNELLLKAAFFPPAYAEKYWMEWKTGNDINSPGWVSRRLLPLVYKNLRVHELKNLYKRTWCENEVLFSQITSLLSLFHEKNIDTLLLKGSAMILSAYKDTGLRPMGDIDILVPREKIKNAFDLMRLSGWVPETPIKCPFDMYYKHVWHARKYRNESGWECDLHWRVLKFCDRSDKDADFWSHARSSQLREVTTLVLSPGDQLLHVIEHGARYARDFAVQWAADSIVILNSSGDSLDWDRFIDLAHKHYMTLRCSRMLFYLKNTFNASLPDTVLKNLQGKEISKFEKKFYARMVCRKRKPAYDYLSLHMQYTRYHLILWEPKPPEQLPKPVIFLKLLQAHLNIRHTWEVLVIFPQKIFYRMIRALK